MGLPPGWVTDPGFSLTPTQQIAALGNGVLPLQAATRLTCSADPGRRARLSLVGQNNGGRRLAATASRTMG